MVRLFWMTTAFAVLAAFAVPVTAQDKKEANTPADGSGKAKLTAEAEAVQKLSLASGLIHLGRKQKMPEALIVAARILADVSTVELKDKPTHETDPKADKSKEKAKAKPDVDNSPKALLEEAKAMSGNNEAIVKLANAVEIKRGAAGGPRRTTEVVEGYGTDVYRIKFRGDEVAKVLISGDGDTRLDLYIYDADGDLVTSQVGPGDDALATWVPRRAGVYTIKVVNRGRAQNKYVLVTN